MKKYASAGLLLMILFVSGCAQPAVERPTTVAPPRQNAPALIATTTSDDPDGGRETAETAVPMQRGSYREYSPETLAEAQRVGRKVVLFFHAPWCPTCRSANEAFLSRPDEIPAGVTVLRVDYDTATALKKKYLVTYQHTLVQVDASGAMVTKWSSGDIDLLKKNIK